MTRKIVFYKEIRYTNVITISITDFCYGGCYLTGCGNSSGSADGVGVITPNPKTSGGARWNYLAAWYYFEQQGQSEYEIVVPSVSILFMIKCQ